MLDPLAGLLIQACAFGAEVTVVTLIRQGETWLALSPWFGAAVIEDEGGSLTLVRGDDVVQVSGDASTLIQDGTPLAGGCADLTAEVRGVAHRMLDQVLAENPDAAVDELRREHQEQVAALTRRSTDEVDTVRTEANAAREPAAEALQAMTERADGLARELRGAERRTVTVEQRGADAEALAQERAREAQPLRECSASAVTMLPYAIDLIAEAGNESTDPEQRQRSNQAASTTLRLLWNRCPDLGSD